MKPARVAVPNEPLVCTKCHVGNVAPLCTGASSQVLSLLCMTVRGQQAAWRTRMYSYPRVCCLQPNALSNIRGAEHSCHMTCRCPAVIGSWRAI